MKLRYKTGILRFTACGA